MSDEVSSIILCGDIYMCAITFSIPFAIMQESVTIASRYVIVVARINMFHIDQFYPLYIYFVWLYVFLCHPLGLGNAAIKK